MIKVGEDFYFTVWYAIMPLAPTVSTRSWKEPLKVLPHNARELVGRLLMEFAPSEPVPRRWAEVRKALANSETRLTRLTSRVRRMSETSGRVTVRAGRRRSVAGDRGGSCGV